MNQKILKPHGRYEKEIMQAIEKDEFIPMAKQQEKIKEITGYFANMPKKNKRITIRVAEHDLKEIQQKAVKHGIPYQTLISALLHRFAKGKIKISV